MSIFTPQPLSSSEAAAAAAIAGAGAGTGAGTGGAPLPPRAGPHRRVGSSAGRGRRSAPSASVSVGPAAAAAAAAGNGSGNAYEQGRGEPSTTTTTTTTTTTASTASTARVISMPGKESHKRVAQACDRCRSKKIRCDGRQPSCSQCAAVGFDCRTSDKLSRRAFPRGYTEMLEELVSDVKAQNTELLGLIEEREAQLRALGIDRDVLLQRKMIDPGRRSSASSSSSGEKTAVASAVVTADGESEVVHWEAGQLEPPSESAPFAGLSSIKAYYECLLRRVSSVVQLPPFSVDAFLAMPPVNGSGMQIQSSTSGHVMDQMLGIYLQEWAPIFPVIHGPTMMHACKLLCGNPPGSMNGQLDFAIVQLNLIGGIVCASNPHVMPPSQLAVFEAAWLPLLGPLEKNVNLEAAQSFVIAQIYHLVRSEYDLALRYRGIACAICHQLGMHLSETRFQHQGLTSQLRRRVFWTQYVLDRFTAAFTGLPVLLDDSEISVEYPDSVGDVLSPVCEGRPMATFIAVIQLSRILTQALEVLYPQSGPLTVSLSVVHELTKNLEKWRDSLIPELHFELGKDRQDDNRCPILGLLYCIVRIYIRRPSLRSDDKHHLCPALQAVAESSRYIIYLVQFLDDQAMVLPMCVSRRALLLFAGVGLVWYASKKQPENKHVKDAERLVRAAVSLTHSETSDGVGDFAALVDALFVQIRGGLWLGLEQEQGEQQQQQQQGQEMQIDTPMPTSYPLLTDQNAPLLTDMAMPLPPSTTNPGAFEPRPTTAFQSTPTSASATPDLSLFTSSFHPSQTSTQFPGSNGGNMNGSVHVNPHPRGHVRARTQPGFHAQSQAAQAQDASDSALSNSRRWSTPDNLALFTGADAIGLTPTPTPAPHPHHPQAQAQAQSQAQAQPPPQPQPHQHPHPQPQSHPQRQQSSQLACHQGQVHLDPSQAALATAAGITAMGHASTAGMHMPSAMAMSMPMEQMEPMEPMEPMGPMSPMSPINSINSMNPINSAGPMGSMGSMGALFQSANDYGSPGTAASMDMQGMGNYMGYDTLTDYNLLPMV